MLSFVCSLLLCIVLLVIVYQDFFHRALSVYVLAGALILSAFYMVRTNGWTLALTYAGMNALLTIIQIAGVFLYFSIKNRTLTNIVNTYIGTGDLLFFGVVIFSFSPVNFVIFNLVSYLLILTVFALLKLGFRYEKTIPFAGCLAMFLMIVLVLSNCYNAIEPYNDDLLWKVLGIGS